MQGKALRPTVTWIGLSSVPIALFLMQRPESGQLSALRIASASSGLRYGQKRGRAALNDITEDDVISYFIREGGRRPLSGGSVSSLST